MHCRIGCRVIGGFIECFDASATINIAGIDKNRARLVNGDILKIGDLVIEVVIPQADTAKSFQIAFDDIEATNVSENAQSVPEPLPPCPSDPQPELGQPEPEISASANKLPIHKFDFDPVAETNLEAGSNGNEQQVETPSPAGDPVSEGASLPQDDVIADADSPSEPEIQELNSAKDSKIQNSDKSSKPVFEFDSVDANDIKLTEEDLDVIENMTGNSLVLQDFDSMVSETFPEEEVKKTTANQSQDSLTTEPAPESGDFVPHGSDSGKCCHWTGRTVLPTVEFIEQRKPELQCYEIQKHLSFALCTFADVKKAVADKNGPKIFLLSNKPEDQLKDFFGAKRWSERIGHPQALSMFLTLLPAKTIKQMFGEVDTCILVQDSDLELVRLNRKLEN